MSGCTTTGVSTKNEKTRKDVNVLLVFGREALGLLSDEVQVCDRVITIPARGVAPIFPSCTKAQSVQVSEPDNFDEVYPSLNLSHAVACVLYELSRAWHDPSTCLSPSNDSETPHMKETDLVNPRVEEIDLVHPRVKENLVQLLHDLSFVKADDKTASHANASEDAAGQKQSAKEFVVRTAQGWRHAQSQAFERDATGAGAGAGTGIVDSSLEVAHWTDPDLVNIRRVLNRSMLSQKEAVSFVKFLRRLKLK